MKLIIVPLPLQRYPKVSVFFCWDSAKSIDCQQYRRPLDNHQSHRYFSAFYPDGMAWNTGVYFSRSIFDFSGYSDMAVGLGKMLGFEFPQNFNYPYLSRSISEFWRRWHITLGTWFRCYVYIPLGGNRNGKLATLRNLPDRLVFDRFMARSKLELHCLGLYFGILIIMERLFWVNYWKSLPLFSTAYCFLLVVIGWVIFEIDSIPKNSLI